MQVTSGPAVEHRGVLAGLLTGLDPREVLFIDEIHRLNPAVEEYLYPAMEDLVIDVPERGRRLLADAAPRPCSPSR